MSTPSVSIGRLVGLALLAFLILASYEATRPPVESLFLAEHGRDALPQVWLLVAVGAAASVAVYNSFAARIALLPLLAGCTVLSAVLLLGLLWASETKLPGHAYLFYLWKDLYIVVLLETFWAYANATTPLKQARWLYGGLLAAGTLGSLTGGTLAGKVAAASGLQATLWLALPLLGGVALVAMTLHRLWPADGGRPDAATVKNARLSEGLRVLRQSDYLTLMLLLILAVQLVTTLVDYAYNGVVAQAYPDAAERTVVISDVYRVVNVAALALQLGAVVVLTLGLGRVFVGMPVLVGATVLALAIHPVFLAAAAAKIVGKCVDYSLFRACKEMLYIPLTYAEKTQGKALVDILTYRISKGGAALALQGLVLLGVAHWSGALAVALVGVWVALAVLIVRRHRERTTREA